VETKQVEATAAATAERNKFKPISLVLFIQPARHGEARRSKATFAQNASSLNRRPAEPDARGFLRRTA
jgi:hypothetical protein